MKIEIKLRPAKPEDFKRPGDDGTDQYLFGKLYYTKVGPELVSADVFRNTPLSRRHFNDAFKAGLVYMPENVNPIGEFTILEE